MVNKIKLFTLKNELVSENVFSAGNIQHCGPQKEWKEIVAVYLFFAGMGAGSFVIGTLISWMDIKPDYQFLSNFDLFGFTLNLSKLAILWGPIMVAVSAPLLILDLGVKKRFMYACRNPRTSWMARGFIILSIFIISGLLLLTKSIINIGWFHVDPILWRSLEVIAFIFAFATAIYTGLLLKTTKSIPLWNTNLLPLLFLVSALTTGSMAIILSTLGTGFFAQDAKALNILMRGEQVLACVEGIVLILFLYRGYTIAVQGKKSVRLLLLGDMKVVFWGGVVLLGFIFPAVLEYTTRLFPENIVLIVSAGIFLLCGGFSLRVAILRAGIKDQIPMWIKSEGDEIHSTIPAGT